MPHYKITDEFVYHCTKCRLDLNHCVTLVEHGQPKRLMCLTCKTERRYSPLKEMRSAGTTKKIFGTKPKSALPQIAWQEKLQNSNRSVKDYTMVTAFSIDDRVRHAVFGLGLVVDVLPPDKIHVYFSDGIKILKCGAII